MHIEITTHSIAETVSLGQTIGAGLVPGTIVALTGDLGSGKTTFTKGLARGLEVPENYHITSPSYTLVNEYPGKHPLFHVDLYRIDDPVDVEDIGLYDMLYGNGIVVIEWADRLDDRLLKERIDIHIEMIDTEKIMNDVLRKFFITAHGLGAINMVKGLKKIKR